MSNGVLAPRPEPVVAPVDDVTTKVVSVIGTGSGLVSTINFDVVGLFRAPRLAVPRTFPVSSGPSSFKVSVQIGSSHVMRASNTVKEERLTLREKIDLLLRGASSITAMVPPRKPLMSGGDKRRAAEKRVSAAWNKVEHILGE